MTDMFDSDTESEINTEQSTDIQMKNKLNIPVYTINTDSKIKYIYIINEYLNKTK